MTTHVRGMIAAMAMTVGLWTTDLIAQSSAPTLAEAKKALEAAESSATKAGTRMGCAVIDARGGMVASMRMDKALYFAVDAARGKALISASFGAPSGTLAERLSPGIASFLPGPVYIAQGAVPLKRNNETIGAIGCGGGSSQQDEDVAKAGAAAAGLN